MSFKITNSILVIFPRDWRIVFLSITSPRKHLIAFNCNVLTIDHKTIPEYYFQNGHDLLFSREKITWPGVHCLQTTTRLEGRIQHQQWCSCQNDALYLQGYIMEIWPLRNAALWILSWYFNNPPPPKCQSIFDKFVLNKLVCKFHSMQNSFSLFICKYIMIVTINKYYHS